MLFPDAKMLLQRGLQRKLELDHDSSASNLYFELNKNLS